MVYWLIKFEFYKYLWEDMVCDGWMIWDGVCNYIVVINLCMMKLGDWVFFYYLNEGKEIVGIVEIVCEYYFDFKDVV